MDKNKRELIIYKHNCPKCYPSLVAMRRPRANVNILVCECCGYEIDDRKLPIYPLSTEEIAYNYMEVVKQILLNTKSDYRKYNNVIREKKINGRARAIRELENIDMWIKNSKLIRTMATLLNMEPECLKNNIHQGVHSPHKYEWSVLFRNRGDLYLEDLDKQG